MSMSRACYRTWTSAKPSPPPPSTPPVAAKHFDACAAASARCAAATLSAGSPVGKRPWVKGVGAGDFRSPRAHSPARAQARRPGRPARSDRRHPLPVVHEREQRPSAAAARARVRRARGVHRLRGASRTERHVRSCASAVDGDVAAAVASVAAAGRLWAEHAVRRAGGGADSRRRRRVILLVAVAVPAATLPRRRECF